MRSIPQTTQNAVKHDKMPVQIQNTRENIGKYDAWTLKIIGHFSNVSKQVAKPNHQLLKMPDFTVRNEPNTNLNLDPPGSESDPGGLLVQVLITSKTLGNCSGFACSKHILVTPYLHVCELMDFARQL